MSLTLAIAVIALADLALLAGLAWLMARARRLNPHAESNTSVAPAARPARRRRRASAPRTSPRSPAHSQA